MLSGPTLQGIYRTLWPEGLPGYTKVFAIADGAQDKRLYGAVDASRQDRCCLYSVERRWGGQDLPWQLLMTGPTWWNSIRKKSLLATCYVMAGTSTGEFSFARTRACRTCDGTFAAC